MRPTGWISDELPAYVYDLAEVRRATEALRGRLPAGSRLLYSMKANPHPLIVRQLVDLGCGVEVSSPGELTIALAAGAGPEAIVYTGPGKAAREIDGALDAGVTLFSVDSAHALRTLNRRADALGRSADCLVRVNARAEVGQGLAMAGGTSQFGVDEELLATEPEFAAAAGLHYYLGSNVAGEDALIGQLRRAVESAAAAVDACGLVPRVLDLGGGFPAPYARAGGLPAFPKLRAALTDALDAAFPRWRQGSPAILFEAGRHLTATCGRLFTRVADVKQSGGRPVVVLESGIHHLGGMSGLRRLPPIVPDVLPLDAGGEVWPDALVAGPLCSPLDSWARSATMPAVRPGDVVTVPNVGAYGLTASLVLFLGQPPPAEVVVDGDRVVDRSRLEVLRRPIPST